MLTIELANRQTRFDVDPPQLIAAVRWVLAEEGIEDGEVSLAVVDDPQIHELNRRYLRHDYATDVLSFTFDRNGSTLLGEVIVSADTAAAAAVRFGWRMSDELLLYVIHGTLHLVGYDDLTPEARCQMRDRERHYLRRYHLEPRYEDV